MLGRNPRAFSGRISDRTHERIPKGVPRKLAEGIKKKNPRRIAREKKS